MIRTARGCISPSSSTYSGLAKTAVSAATESRSPRGSQSKMPFKTSVMLGGVSMTRPMDAGGIHLTPSLFAIRMDHLGVVSLLRSSAGLVLFTQSSCAEGAAPPPSAKLQAGISP